MTTKLSPLLTVTPPAGPSGALSSSTIAVPVNDNSFATNNNTVTATLNKGSSSPYGNATANITSSGIHNASGNRKHRPPAKKQMGSVFRYLTDVKGSALSEIVSTAKVGVVGGGVGTTSGGGVGRAQTAPTASASPRKNAMSLAGGSSPRGAGNLLNTTSVTNPSAANPSSSSSEGKIRMLDEYLKNFPLDRPKSAVPLNPKGSADPDTSTASRGNRQAALDQEIKRYEQEAHTRKIGKEAATKTFNNFRKKQNFEGWLAVSERNNRKMRRENDALAKLSQIAQENCIDNDSKYEQVLADLRNSVELAAVIRRRDDPNLKLMEAQFNVIDKRIDDVCETAKEEVAKEYTNLKKAFARQVEKQNDQLEVVRESGKTTTEEWRKRNQEAQEGLLNVLQRLVEADEEKQVHQKDLQKLRVAQGAQDGDGEILEDSFRKATRRHQQLKERMQLLEAELSRRNAANFAGKAIEDDVNATTRELIETSGRIGETLLGRDEYQRKRGIMGVSSALAASPLSSAHSPSDVGVHGRTSVTGSGIMLTEAERRQRDYAQTLKNAEELLETEAHNLRSVRASHAAALKQRTELEVFLLQAILAHRHWKEHKIKEGALSKPFGATVDDNNTQSAELVFTTEDRRKVIERLLSHERVLRFLYGGVAEGDENIDDGYTASASAALPSLRPTAPNSATSSAQGGGRSSSAYGLRGVQAMTPSLVSPQQLGAVDQTEVNQLWDKWRRWTREAKSALQQQYVTENVRD